MTSVDRTEVVITLTVDPKHKLLVHFWPTLKALREAGEKANCGGHTTGAFFYSGRYALEIGERKVRVLNKNVGHIHLCRKRFNVGIFAHELQHFIQSWIDVNELRVKPREQHWETVAYLVGDLTNEFWEKFYEHYKVSTEAGKR